MRVTRGAVLLADLRFRLGLEARIDMIKELDAQRWDGTYVSTSLLDAIVAQSDADLITHPGPNCPAKEMV